MRNNDYVAAMCICDVKKLVEKLLNTIEVRYEISFDLAQREEIFELCEREIDAHVIGVPTERKEIDRLKAELAAYIELGTPDEFAKALTAANKTNYPAILDKYRDARKVITEKQGEIIKLRGVLAALNEKVDRMEAKERKRDEAEMAQKPVENPEDKIVAILKENNRLNNENTCLCVELERAEKRLEQRNRVCQGRKERIAQLKAALKKSGDMIISLSKQCGRMEEFLAEKGLRYEYNMRVLFPRIVFNKENQDEGDKQG